MKKKHNKKAGIVAQQFSKAYFSGDIDGVKALLAKSYTGEPECYQPNRGEFDEVEIVRVKGIENINLFNMGKTCHFSVECVLVNDDSLSYLETDIVREKSGWRIESYGLEK